MTAKELEQHTGCKIMVRGKGSMRDKAKEDQNRGKPNWEHLSEDLHVLITVEDTRNRAEVKLSRAKDEIQRLLVPAPEGEDELKKKQLLELAILNGTYRDQKPVAMFHPLQPRFQAVQPAFFPPPDGARFLQPVQLPMRAATPSPAGAPIILAPRLPPQLAPMTVTSTGIFNGAPPPLVSPPGEAGTLMYNPYEQIQHTVPLSLAAAATAAPTVMEYPRLDPTAAAGATKMRRIVGVREHPYSRV
ncbi:KH domain-containing RNA-binding protein QKI-like isoform X4 [Babylonia areolata]